MTITTLTIWIIFAIDLSIVTSSGEWQAPIRKSLLDTNRNGHIEKEECLCNVKGDLLDPPKITRDMIDYSMLRKYETIAYSIAAMASAMEGDIDPRVEIALLSDMLYQDPRGILGCWLGYTPDSYGTAFNKSYDMTKSVGLISHKDCAHSGGCDLADEHIQENITVRFFEQLGRNASLHLAYVYADACCNPVSYGDYLRTSEGAWIWNYFTPDPTFDFFNLPLRDYLYGNITWLRAGKWSAPYVDPVAGVKVSFSVPYVTKFPVPGSVDPFIYRDTGHAHPGFMKSFEGLYVLGVVGIDVRLSEIALACADGFYSTYPTCSACPSGTYRAAADPGDTCVACAPGSYTDKNGSSACTRCLRGYSQFDAGKTSCDKCPPGTAQPDLGMSTCSLCAMGSAIADWNSSDCGPCSVGQYSAQRGATACLPCPNSMTTGGYGATSFHECICDEGTFHGATSQTCEICPIGMTCQLGSVEPSLGNWTHSPSLLPGYYSRVDNPLSVFFCTNNKSCPGGSPGTCSGGRIAVGCELCEAGQYASTQGDCLPCGSDASGPIVALFIVGLTAAAVNHVAVNMPVVKSTYTSLAGGSLVRQVMSTILSFSIYANLTPDWDSPMSDLLLVLRVVAFDIRILKFSCVTGASQLILSYAVRLAAIPCAFLAVTFFAFSMNLTKWTRCYAFFSIPDLINSGGVLVLLFFIALCLACLEGFMCIRNPNGLETLVGDRSVLCWVSTDHFTLVTVSTIAVLVYPVGILAMAGYSIWKYHTLTERFGPKFTLCMRFLMTCWKPDHYYFGIMYTLRSFALTIAPITYSNNYDMQVTLLQFIHLIWLLVQLNFRPWRCEILNKYDAITTAMQIIVLTCFGLLGGHLTTDSIGVHSAGVIAFVAFVLVMILASSISAVTLAQMLGRAKQYGLFLSHHKGADALYARQIKLMLTKLTTRRVFLDVDNLASLDELVLLVCKSIDNLVVMLSPETLNRFWCAVEIICATKNHIPIILTNTHPVEKLLGDELLNRIPDMWGPDQITEFRNVGIEATIDTELAYKFLATLPIIPMLMRSPESEQMQAVTKLVSVAKSCRTEKRTYKMDGHLLSYIAYNTTCFAQTSCARILCMLMKTNRWNCLILEDEFRAPEVKKSVLLILVSQGLARDPIGLGHAYYMNANGVPFTTIVSQESFEDAKPSKDCLKQLLEGGAFAQEQLATFHCLAPGVSESSIADLLVLVYGSLAASLNPQDSEHMLLVEMSTIVKRAEQHLAGLAKVNGRPPSPSAGSCPTTPTKKQDTPSLCFDSGNKPDRPGRAASPSKGSSGSRNTSPRRPTSPWKGFDATKKPDSARKPASQWKIFDSDNKSRSAPKRGAPARGFDNDNAATPARQREPSQRVSINGGDTLEPSLGADWTVAPPRSSISMPTDEWKYGDV